MLLLSLFFAFSPALAQEADNNSYSYDIIAFNFQVNPDSTVTVEERQTFNYQGEFHKGWRFIPLSGVGTITDIEVIDGTTGKLLTYSAKTLDKLDPESWGKFTTYRGEGGRNIEWYYNLKDTKQEWILRYKLHGALSFYDNHDEFYWNLFTNYEVPVSKVTAQVKLPPNNFKTEDLQASLYWARNEGDASHTEQGAPFVGKQAGGIYNFYFENLEPRAKVTIAAGWPKGLGLEKAFWSGWLKSNWGYILSVLVGLFAIIYGFAQWYFLERFRKGRGTVIAEYEPPQHLKPAMMEVVVRERVSPRTWPATIVDLAVRGYLKIKEERKNRPGNVWLVVTIILIFVLISFFVSLVISETNGIRQGWVRSLGFLPLLLIFLAFLPFIYKKYTRGYLLERTEKREGLEDYERDFLGVLFGRSQEFSTLDLASHPFKAQTLGLKIQELEKELYKEIDSDLGVYEVALSKKTNLKFSGLLVFFAVWLLLSFGSFLALSFSPQVIILSSTVFVSFVILWSFKQFNPRLSQAGHVLREACLGFKLYLKTAERYRLQNLTPDLFEKFLPYAMIFGVEKKWAKAFEGINVPNPSWYVPAHGGVVGGGEVGTFSASAFSSSFSSSFASAFSNSTGGASGGGGGAGGGGGGGGGGAS